MPGGPWAGSRYDCEPHDGVAGPAGEGESPRDAKEFAWGNLLRSMVFKKLGGESNDVTVETLRRLKAQSDIANVRLGF
jgi:hypothetical protein